MILFIKLLSKGVTVSTKPFFLAVRGILQDHQGRFLLLKRSRSSKHQPGFWEFAGGKVDPGEDFASALLREFKEETGLTVSLDSVFGSGEWEREDYRIAYLFMKVSLLSGDVSISREHDEFRWFSKEELKKLNVSPQLKPLCEALTH